MSERKLVWVLISLVLVGLIGTFDYLTGYELASAPFYLIPIFIVTWYTTLRWGVVFALLSALAWLTTELLLQHPYSQLHLFFTNTLIRLLNFMIVVSLTERVKQENAANQRLARSDGLTSLANSRAFYEILQRAINHLLRYHKPFSVVFLDLDNFKQVNDTFGHSEGDRVLHQVAGVLLMRLRKTDYAARLGGDEFAILLPETGQDEARWVCEELMALLTSVMDRHNAQITMSMGVVAVTQATPDLTADQVIQQADQLMYQAKQAGKNNIKSAALKVN